MLLNIGKTFCCISPLQKHTVFLSSRRTTLQWNKNKRFMLQIQFRQVVAIDYIKHIPMCVVQFYIYARLPAYYLRQVDGQLSNLDVLKLEVCRNRAQEKCKQKYFGKIDLLVHFLTSAFIRKFASKLRTSLIAPPNAKVIKLPNAHVLFIPTLEL